MKAIYTAAVVVLTSANAFASETAYPAMAPLAQYRTVQADEVALAKSAAPSSIADHAEVLVLGEHGYQTAVTGTNGFVCLVVRSWDVAFADPQFWNPKIRAPQCMNAVAARSVLPRYLARTEWVLSGVPKAEIQRREAAARAAGKIKPPDPEAISYMMSKHGYLNDDAGHWHPHVMFFSPRNDVARWGANLDGSPILADTTNDEDANVFFVVVARWSDGTPGPTH